MAREKNKLELWIRTGYRCFANKGLFGIKIKKIGNEINESRTNFYYYFDNKAVFIEALLKHHRSRIEFFFSLLNEKQVKDLSVFMEVLTGYTEELKFHRQLFLLRDHSPYREIYNLSDSRTTEVILPMLLRFFDIKEENTKAAKMIEQLKNVWYAKLDIMSLDSETLKKYTADIYGIIQMLNSSPVSKQ